MSALRDPSLQTLGVVLSGFIPQRVGGLREEHSERGRGGT